MSVGSQLTVADVGIIVGVYVGAVLLTIIFRKSEMGRNFFALFTRSGVLVAGIVIMLVLTTSIALSYMDWVSTFVVGALAVTAILSIGYFAGKGLVSIGNSLSTAALVVVLLLGVVLTIWKRWDMSEEVQNVVTATVLSFWVAGYLVYKLMPHFAEQVKPGGKTRTLLILLLLSFYCLLHSLGDWSAAVVSIFSALLLIAWVLRPTDRLLSVSLTSYRENPDEISMYVTTLFFVVLLNFSLMMSKDHSQQPESLFDLNIVLFVIVILLVLSAYAFEAIGKISNSTKSRKKIEPNLEDFKNMDIFGQIALQGGKKSVVLPKSIVEPSLSPFTPVSYSSPPRRRSKSMP